MKKIRLTREELVFILIIAVFLMILGSYLMYEEGRRKTIPVPLGTPEQRAHAEATSAHFH